MVKLDNFPVFRRKKEKEKKIAEKNLKIPKNHI
jgi:hypothetical protein